MILVVGSSGLLGGMIARELLSRGQAVRILTRSNPAYQSLIDAGAQAVQGDLKDRASLDKACDGVDVVITTANAVQRGGDDTFESVDLRGTQSLIDAAKAAHVKQFIYTSAATANVNSPDPFNALKGQVERYLIDSGLPYTILAPHIFMDVWLPIIIGIPLSAGQPITLSGQGSHRHSFIAVKDIAAIAAATVNNPSAINQRILIGGPEAISWTEIVQRSASVLGRELVIKYVPVGTPIPQMPDAVSGLLHFSEMMDFEIDMAQVTQKYNVALTPVESIAREVLRVNPEKNVG